MATYLIRRLLLLVPVILGISAVVFGLSHLIPGDPVTVLLGQETTPAEAARLRTLLGLDKPLPVQYMLWLSRVVQGDLGKTLFGGQAVADLLRTAVPATLELSIAALVLGLIIALPLGIVSAVRRGSVIDMGSMLVALLGVSTPVFWSGILLILAFSLWLGWLPFNGRGPPLLESIAALARGSGPADLVDSLRHLALPALALGTTLIGPIARLTRSSMLEVLGREYVWLARAKGLRDRDVVLRHALKNALLPVVTVLGVQVGGLLGGAIITETVFAWPGVGRLIVTAILQHDYAVSQGGVLVVAVLFSAINLLVDLSYAYLNPRIRYGG
jgi:ABC-type dipeptide/oligopeptide/nickel transport system permease component